MITLHCGNNTNLLKLTLDVFIGRSNDWLRPEIFAKNLWLFIGEVFKGFVDGGLEYGEVLPLSKITMRICFIKYFNFSYFKINYIINSVKLNFISGMNDYSLPGITNFPSKHIHFE